MNRMTHLCATCVAVLAWTLTFVLLLAPAAGAAARCEQRLIDDWSADGRIDKVYELHCYEDAIAALPLELRDYSDLADVIQRSQSAAVVAPELPGTGGVAAVPVVDTSGMSSYPFPLLLLAAVSLGLLAAGAVSYTHQRRRALRDPSRR
jgi:hypothetical protein